MEIDVNTIVSIVSVCAAIFFGYHAFMHSSLDDTEEKASMNARVLTKLDMISDDIKEVKRDSQDLRKEVSHINERVLILEQSFKLRKSDQYDDMKDK